MSHGVHPQLEPIDEYIANHGVRAAIGAKKVASLLLTYRCTIACAHCLFNCTPKHPRRHHTVEQGVRYMRQLRATDRCIHIAGGEAMMEHDTMLAICRGAAEQNANVHFIETNTTWCTSKAIARKRFTELKDAGVKGILMSCDPFHLAFYPVDRNRRCYEMAVEFFGEANVVGAKMTRKKLLEMQQTGRDPARVAEHVRGWYAPRFVGRAGEELARHLPERPIEDLAKDGMWHGPVQGMSCALEFDPDTMWEIHLDPYGNIQTCCGIIIGNADRLPLPEHMAKGFIAGNPIVSAVVEEGPVALLQMAEALGYQRGAYVQKCHLCWEVRKFLRPHYPEILGPEEIYGPQNGARPKG